MKVLKYVLRMQGTIENCKKEIKTITKKPKEKQNKKHKLKLFKQLQRRRHGSIYAKFRRTESSRLSLMYFYRQSTHTAYREDNFA